MRYYVMADIHGFYTAMMTALDKAGYNEYDGPKKIIICGDLFDRGKEAFKVQKFVLDHMKKNDIILIRGNNEDLVMDLLNDWGCGGFLQGHHRSNGTISTVLQLTFTKNISTLMADPDSVYQKMMLSPYITDIIPATRDYFETQDYIFVHGWIPCHVINYSRHSCMYLYRENWRNAPKTEWMEARWTNGMEAHHSGVREEGKTIVCGHYHCSYGHWLYEGVGGELDKTSVFTPYYDKGIIAIDACTAYSGLVNCLVIDQ